LEHQNINKIKIKTRGKVVHLIFGVRDVNAMEFIHLNVHP
jgi:hypothetical protein